MVTCVADVHAVTLFCKLAPDAPRPDDDDPAADVAGHEIAARDVEDVAS